jgi:DNA-binding transcriptional ArsR family regulator
MAMHLTVFLEHEHGFAWIIAQWIFFGHITPPKSSFGNWEGIPSICRSFTTFIVSNGVASERTTKSYRVQTGKDELSASEISDKFQVSPQAISQHLKVLREANLMHKEKRVQQRIYRINTDAIVELEEWSKNMRHRWSRRLDAGAWEWPGGGYQAMMTRIKRK